MKPTCLHCNKDLPEHHDKFCSISCKKAYLANLKRRLGQAVANDAGHTKKLSHD